MNAQPSLQPAPVRNPRGRPRRKSGSLRGWCIHEQKVAEDGAQQRELDHTDHLVLRPGLGKRDHRNDDLGRVAEGGVQQPAHCGTAHERLRGGGETPAAGCAFTCLVGVGSKRFRRAAQQRGEGDQRQEGAEEDEALRRADHLEDERDRHEDQHPPAGAKPRAVRHGRVRGLGCKAEAAYVIFVL